MIKKDITEIIKLCIKYNVKSFKNGEFHVEFGEQPVKRPRNSRVLPNAKPGETMEDTADRLLLEDPVAHEELISKMMLEGK